MLPKIILFILFLLFLLGSCSVNKSVKEIKKTEISKYELAYNTIAKEKNKETPLLSDYGSDASGVKIIPKIYRLNNSEQFDDMKSYTNKKFTKLSHKYSKRNWRKDKDYKILMPEDIKTFHGPLKYIYFSEIKNDSLRADILNNPLTKYYMTTVEHYLIIFENNQIKSIQKAISHYCG